MRRMGGLRQHMPLTFATMLIGAVAIAGIPPLSGFFSKDEILYRTFLSNQLLWGIGAITAVMTAFYMFRLINMTFLGQYRGPAPDAEGHGDSHGHAWHGPHESPRLMTWARSWRWRSARCLPASWACRRRSAVAT